MRGDRRGPVVTVYVDNMRSNYRQMVMCHMLGDSESELHTMADQIGVKRRWYQGDHYDICLAKRSLALKAGAIEITARQAAAMRRRRRETGELGVPGGAEEWLRRMLRERRAAAAMA
ncbi:MAG: hypothetical protein FD131_5128 [Rhodocyclaceae bacterium]|nr:MAG: hypothetical protein FD131_5128 [Rhodocyclaceae bacterium]